MYELKSILDSSIRKDPEIGALATKDSRSAAVMVWNYHDEDKQQAAENIHLEFRNLPRKNITVTQYRIDADHSNSYEAWKKMGSPQTPTTAQIAEYV